MSLFNLVTIGNKTFIQIHEDRLINLDLVENFDLIGNRIIMSYKDGNRLVGKEYLFSSPSVAKKQWENFLSHYTPG